MMRRVLALALALGLVLGLVGCQKTDEIQTYKVPKTSDSPNPNAVRAEALPDAKEYRILGAMFPADAPEWFFRVVGPSDSLTAHKEKFETMLKTVRFPNGLQNPPVWETPEGWKLGGGRPGRAMGGIMIAGPSETILINGDKNLEITVTAAQGDPFANIKRWYVNLLGNPDLTPADMANVTKPIDAQGIKGLMADLRGPKNPNTGRMMGGQ